MLLRNGGLRNFTGSQGQLEIGSYSTGFPIRVRVEFSVVSNAVLLSFILNAAALAVFRILIAGRAPGTAGKLQRS